MATASLSGSASSSSKKAASSTERIAPPPPLHEENSARLGRDRSSLASLEEENGSSNDWLGHNTRVMASDGTVATLTSGSDETVRRGKTNFEVIYDKEYTAKTSPDRPKFVSAYSAKENARNGAIRGRNLGRTKTQSLSKSWHVRSRPKGAAAMAEF